MHASYLARLLRYPIEVELLRWALIVIFVLFGYAKWFDYEANALIPLVSNSPLLSWLYPTLGIHGASYLLGAVEWTLALLLLAGICAPSLTLLAAAGSSLTFLLTSSLILTTPGCWDASVGGFPALGSTAGFLIKDIVLLAGSLLLLRHAARQLRTSECDGRCQRYG
ncbi:YkgB family protein [Pseudomonas cremoricolorata]|uniref:YkgB family protein n=1 Tax=Pseudomonas cremoricolorata TaxID=157783 RepID=UPI00067EFA10|nr:DUF417 family protein [Pseudomonas cremoricolorata]